jgi:hypothetical protein
MCKYVLARRSYELGTKINERNYVKRKISLGNEKLSIRAKKSELQEITLSKQYNYQVGIKTLPEKKNHLRIKQDEIRKRQLGALCKVDLENEGE